MAKSKIILDELKEISEAVADLPADHPFVVPPKYFEGLPDQMVVLVRSLPGEEMSTLGKEGKPENPFAVPEGYFENLAASVLKRIQASSANPVEELQLLSPLLGKADRKPPFTVPEGYFNEMPSNVVAGIKAIDFVQAELEILPSPLLETKNKNVFTVPEGYFEELPKEIVKRLRPRTKILSFNVPTRIVRFAAAAAVIGLMALGFLYIQRDTEPMVAVSNRSTELDASIKQLSDEELRNYVENSVPTLPEPAATSVANLQQEDMKDLLADVPDKDIESYLKAYGISDKELNN